MCRMKLSWMTFWREQLAKIALINVCSLIKGTSTKSPLPILYVEGDAEEPADEMLMSKRSGRYYRRYPWKRQNTRSRTWVHQIKWIFIVILKYWTCTIKILILSGWSEYSQIIWAYTVWEWQADDQSEQNEVSVRANPPAGRTLHTVRTFGPGRTEIVPTSSMISRTSSYVGNCE